MIHRIEIVTAPRHTDPRGEWVRHHAQMFSGLKLAAVRTCDVYAFDSEAIAAGRGRSGHDGKLEAETLHDLGGELFADPILHEVYADGGALERIGFDWYVEVGFLPGVTDNLGRTAKESLQYRLGSGWAEGHQVHSATGYFLTGDLEPEDVARLAREWLANELIQSTLIMAKGEVAGCRDKLFRLPRMELTAPVRVETVTLGDRAAMEAISESRLLALNDEEMAAIQSYYARDAVRRARSAAGLGPDPTDVELEVLAQTWSEHCKHKIFNAEIEYTDEQGRTEIIRSLFDTYIRGTTDRVREAHGERDWCLSVFVDNAGVVKFDDDWSFVFKVETHNSPSALDPYGGALTGIVGVNRDPFGTGRGAELLFNTDVFCFASPFHEAPLPPRLLHPRRIYEGVRLGVEHGGNKSGIPTINGSLTFHERFLGQPLVFCGTGGIMPASLGGRPSHEKWVSPGHRVVMVGGRVGKDGIHGATFSSRELDERSPVSAVQIGDPITQKKMFDFLIVARDRALYTAITDNGAGGLSSSVGEMATFCGGAEIHLDRAPLKYPGLQPWEIFISESQERMTLAVSPDHIPELLELARAMDVEATDLGQFTDSGYLRAWHDGRVVLLLDMDFLHHGVPTMRIKARWQPPIPHEPNSPATEDAGAVLIALLGRLNICSKESVVRRYDHEVQGASVVKPLVGVADDGPSDAAVIRPVLESNRGLAVAHGICPRYSDFDTHAMAGCAVDEAVRSLVAVGADPEQIAGLDNFCWCDPLPSPTNPDAEFKAAQLVRAAQALAEVCEAYGVPLISGKDSMKNDYVWEGRRLSILPTLLFSAVGIVEDVRRCVTMDVKAPGDGVYLIGDTRREMGGSEYHAHLGVSAGDVPRVLAHQARHWYRALAGAIRNGWVRSAHDCSDGGLAVALAESAFAGGFGMDLRLGELAREEGLSSDELLFSETPSRLVVTVASQHIDDFEAHLDGLPCHCLGHVSESARLRITGDSGETWLEVSLADLKAAWQETLREM
ncbi:MAG: phosphoribosylformylglycinamidine synthase [SAR324 cluster bacterium]|nr:phosphoribosylformylglycinamidine synthase [SAR324 cluster bacterium]